MTASAILCLRPLTACAGYSGVLSSSPGLKRHFFGLFATPIISAYVPSKTEPMTDRLRGCDHRVLSRHGWFKSQGRNLGSSSQPDGHVFESPMARRECQEFWHIFFTVLPIGRGTRLIIGEGRSPRSLPAVLCIDTKCRPANRLLLGFPHTTDSSAECGRCK